MRFRWLAFAFASSPLACNLILNNETAYFDPIDASAGGAGGASGSNGGGSAGSSVGNTDGGGAAGQGAAGKDGSAGLAGNGGTAGSGAGRTGGAGGASGSAGSADASAGSGGAAGSAGKGGAGTAGANTGGAAGLDGGGGVAGMGGVAGTGSGGAAGTTGGSTGTGGASGKGGNGGTGGTGGASGSGAAGSGGSGTAGVSGSGGGAGTGGSGASGGSGGNGGNGGSIDAGPDNGGTGGTGGTGPGTSLCGAPLFVDAPTAASVEADGALTVTSYTGLPTSTTYASLTVFYPTNGTGPYVVVMLSPGTAEVLSLLTPWAKRLASHGYVAVFVEPNNTSSDTAQMRADGQWDAVATMKAENTRAGSPLVGKLSDCYVVAGHSFGGGAALLNANAHPTEVKAALGFNPYETTTFSAIVAPTLILTGQNDTTAPPASHGLKHYNDIPATTVKEYVEIAGGNHQSALNPGTVPSHYTISWIKYNVDGDTRYRPLLDMVSTGLSGFQTTLP